MRAATTISTLPVIAAAWLVAPAAVAVQTNCDDPEALAGWRVLLERYPRDHDLRKLYELRGKLCAQTKRGALSIDEASERFEEARQRLKRKWERENERMRQPAVGVG